MVEFQFTKPPDYSLKQCFFQLFTPKNRKLARSVSKLLRIPTEINQDANFGLFSYLKQFSGQQIILPSKVNHLLQSFYRLKSVESLVLSLGTIYIFFMKLGSFAIPNV